MPTPPPASVLDPSQEQQIYEALMVKGQTDGDLTEHSTPAEIDAYIEPLLKAEIARQSGQFLESPAPLRFGQGVARSLGNTLEGFKQIPSAIQKVVDDPRGVGNAYIKGKFDALDAGAKAFGKGEYSEAVRQFGGAVPFIGPPAVAAGDRIAQGDIAGGLGEGVTLLGQALAPAVAQKTGQGMSQLGEAIRPDPRASGGFFGRTTRRILGAGAGYASGGGIPGAIVGGIAADPAGVKGVAGGPLRVGGKILQQGGRLRVGPEMTTEFPFIKRGTPFESVVPEPYSKLPSTMAEVQRTKQVGQAKTAIDLDRAQALFDQGQRNKATAAANAAAGKPAPAAPPPSPSPLPSNVPPATGTGTAPVAPPAPPPPAPAAAAPAAPPPSTVPGAATTGTSFPVQAPAPPPPPAASAASPLSPTGTGAATPVPPFQGATTFPSIEAPPPAAAPAAPATGTGMSPVAPEAGAPVPGQATQRTGTGGFSILKEASPDAGLATPDAISAALEDAITRAGASGKPPMPTQVESATAAPVEAPSAAPIETPAPAANVAPEPTSPAPGPSGASALDAAYQQVSQRMQTQGEGLSEAISNVARESGLDELALQQHVFGGSGTVGTAAAAETAGLPTAEIPPQAPAKPRASRARPTSRDAPVNQPQTVAYKGYLVKYNPLNGEYWVEKGGQTVARVKSPAEGRAAVDQITQPAKPPAGGYDF